MLPLQNQEDVLWAEFMFIENVPCKRTHFLWSAPGITPTKQLILFI
jgi:hypothetical protein